jgi:DNA-binding transcriptional ArsR family regulator
VPAKPDPFEALADPTRRAILDVLRDEGEVTAGALAARFPRISRPAVSRHLKVLRQSRLVVARQAGREWRYSLDARGLAEVYRGWFAQFEPIWMQRSAG